MNRATIIGILGVLIVLVAFLEGLPQNLDRALLMIFGLAIAVLSFWKGKREKMPSEESQPREMGSV